MARKGPAGALARARRGSMLPLVAMGVGAIAGAGALGVDAGWLYLQRDRLQQAADAVALAGARQLPDTAAARAAAAAFAGRLPEKDRVSLQPGDVTPGVWDRHARRFTAGGAGANAVRVELRRGPARDNAVPTFLAALFGVGEVGLTASSIARRASPACIYALDSSGPKALDMNGGSGLAIPACTIQVNSTAGDALNATGGSAASALETCVEGNYSLAGGSSVSPLPETGCRGRPDPFVGFTPPPTGGCDWIDKKLSGGAVTLGPGVYCGGLSLAGGTEATFLPGIYVMKDGALESSGGSTLEGHGVGFYLTGPKASVQLTGGGRIDLSAPTSGPMAGFVFATGPDVPAGTSNKLAGGGQMRFAGALYFPGQDLTLSGGSEGLSPSPFTVIVGRRINITGGGTLRFGADSAHPTVPPGFRPQMAPAVVQ
ncbi:TadG family pilus assembly protein [Geminicoccaceae bacterium 1502E]|nr:TadG family pilus assembly protein [Geminicoccaceae bacterium 1502E]